MKVWLTRSQPGADRQAEALRAAGHRVVVAPVIVIEGLAAETPDGPWDLVIFLSEHAVRFGLPALRREPWFAAARVLAVGARTAAVLEDAGVTATSPEPPTSEGLLALPDLVQVRDAAVLLVRGAGGRELLGDELSARGARVEQVECDRRRPVARLAADVADCDVVIAASGEGLRQAARLWLSRGGRRDVPVLVPSARVAGLAVEVGLARLHDCGGADSQAWLHGLEQLQAARGR